MATETTFTPSFQGRIPAFGSKVPGPGLKMKYGKFTVGTSEYPIAGYAAADLETITGLTHIECIIPCGVWMNGTAGIAGFIPSWDGVARTLKAYGNLGLDGMALTTGTVNAVGHLVANDASIDGAILWAIVIGY